MVDYSTPSPDFPNPSAPPPIRPTPVAEAAGFKDAKWLFVGGSLSGTLIIGFISVYQWLPPFMPIALALGMGGALCAMVAFLLCNYERGSAFAKGFLIWGLLALPTGLWALGPVRAGVVEIFNETLTQPAQFAAMNDVDEQVRLRTCVALGTHNEGTMAREIMASLFQTPEESARCIEEVAQGDPEGASRLATAYLSRWDAALRSQDDANICGATPYVLNMSALTTTQPELALTECAATYPDAGVAVCCADALTAHYSDPAAYAGALGFPDGLPSTQRANLFTSLVAYAFGSLGADRRPLPEFETKLLQTPPGQDWVLALGCDGVLNSLNPQAFVAALEVISAQQGCAEPSGYARDTNQWKNICSEWAAPPERSANLCAPIATEARVAAVRTGSALVHNAIGAFFANLRNEQIALGVSAIEGASGEFTDVTQLLGQAFKASNLPPGSDPRLRMAAHDFQANGAEYARIIREYSGSNDLPDGAAMVQKLQANTKQHQWSEMKEHAQPEKRQEYQDQIDDAFERAVSSGIDPDSPALDILR